MDAYTTFRKEAHEPSSFYPEAFGLEDEPNKDFLKSLYYLHISNRTFSGEITPLIEDKDFITHMPYANFVLPIDDFTKMPFQIHVKSGYESTIPMTIP